MHYDSACVGSPEEMYLCYNDLKDFLRQELKSKENYWKNLEFYHGILQDRKYLLVEKSRAQELFIDLDLSVLQVNEYVNVQSFNRNDFSSLDKIIQKVNRFNSKAAKSEKMLGFSSSMLSEATEFTRNTTGKTILCFDVEVLETCHRFILEIGWCTFKTGSTFDQDSTAKTSNNIHARHYIIQENLKKKNGRYVPNHKHLFSFGTSEVQPLKYVIDQLIKDLMVADCVIGHSVDSDFEFLKGFLEFNDLDGFMIQLDKRKFKNKRADYQSTQVLKFETLNITVQLEKRVDQCKFPIKVKKFDTMLMTSAIIGDAFNNCSLKNALQLFDSTRDEEYTFHNAGNDAYATMKLFLALVNETDLETETISTLTKH